MALTRITKGVIKPNENYDTHNINSTGIITATKFVGPLDAGVSGTNSNFTGIVTAATFKGNIVGTAATFTGPVTIGGTLTYEDVTNIDSVGLVTARAGVKIPDSQSLILGSDDDAELKHTGANLVIRNTTGNIRIEPKSGQLAIQSQADERTSIYFSGSKKIETTNTGAVVTGILTATEYRGGGSIGIKISSAGKVGIGTNNPGNTVHLGGTQGVGARWHNYTSGNSAYLTLEAGDKFSSNVGGTGYYNWVTGGAPKMTLTNAGILGIGTAVPVGKNLESYNTGLSTPSLTWGAGNPGQRFVNEGSELKFGLTAYAPYALFIQANTSSNTHRQITLNPMGGSVAIGVTDPPTLSGLVARYDSTFAPTLTWNAAGGHILRNEGSELVFGLSNSSPHSYFIQGRTSGSAARQIVLNPLGGNVGVGTDNPAQRVTSYTASGYCFLANGPSNGIGLGNNGAILFGTKDLGSYAKGIIDASELEFKISGTPKVYMHSNGKVSIGVDNDSYEFTVQGSGGGAPTVWLRDGTTSGDCRILFGDTGNAGQGAIYYKNNGDSLNFYAGGNLSDDRISIKSNGQVKVTSNSEPQLDVHSQTSAAGASMRVQSAGAYAYHMAISSNIHWRWGMPTGTADWVLRESTNGRDRFWVDTGNGAYFKGTSHTNLEIRSNDSSTKAIIQTVQGTDVRIGATTNHPLALYAGSNQRAFINTNGNMGVGIGDPSQARLVAHTASGMSIAAVKDNTGASISLGGVTQPRILMEAGASASDFILYRSTGSSYSSAGWYKTLTIQANGSFRTHKADSSLRPYPIIGGPDIGSSDAEYGQFNYADVMAPQGDLGSWVYLGTDYHGAAPWPVKCYKIAQHEPGNNGTRVYQIWHDGDSNHHYGGLYEVRLNSWGGADSNNFFTSAAISCINGMRDDISLLCYRSTDGIWVRPTTIWGGIWIRRAGWDGSGRDRGSTYCAVKNGGALAYGDINGLGGTIPGSIDKRLYPYVDTYSPGQSYGGRDIEDGNDFVAG